MVEREFIHPRNQSYVLVVAKTTSTPRTHRGTSSYCTHERANSRPLQAQRARALRDLFKASAHACIERSLSARTLRPLESHVFQAAGPAISSMSGGQLASHLDNVCRSSSSSAGAEATWWKPTSIASSRSRLRSPADGPK